MKYLAEVRIKADVIIVMLPSTDVTTTSLSMTPSAKGKSVASSTLTYSRDAAASPLAKPSINDVFGAAENSSTREIIDAGGEENSVDVHPISPQASDGSAQDRMMSIAARLNKQMVKHSANADLVVTNLPLLRSDEPEHFMAYVERILQGIPRSILVRGTKKEVVTAYA